MCVLYRSPGFTPKTTWTVIGKSTTKIYFKAQILIIKSISCENNLSIIRLVSYSSFPERPHQTHPQKSVTSREKRELLPPSENLSSRKTSAATAPIKAINNVKAFIYEKWSEEDRKITKTSLHGWPGRTSDGNCTKPKAQNSLVPCLLYEQIFWRGGQAAKGYWTVGERIAPIASCQQKPIVKRNWKLPSAGPIRIHARHLTS